MVDKPTMDIDEGILDFFFLILDNLYEGGPAYTPSWLFYVYLNVYSAGGGGVVNINKMHKYIYKQD